ncbi:right-handed parallel beta-helix repeat-containing protein [Massilia litorea]|jgi:hypothetical protein|uniref:hypothetical protein n=1 Tax=Massilia litorea TaxID=2769491 RepID=UPI001D0D6F4F|nr:hypothetical protein [Massilia litorea]
MQANRNSSTRLSLALTAVVLGAAIAAPASAATRSVGYGKTYATPCKAFAAAAAGDVIEIQAGTYTGDVCYIAPSNLTIRGVNGRPKIAAGGKSAGGKAIWVVSGNNITIDNVEMYGAKVVDKNGAALRLEGTNFTMRNSFLHDNENGILSGVNTASTIVLENNEFGHNGYGDGYSHNVYIGKAGKLTFRYNYSHDANVGHNLKTRALYNTIAYNRFSSLRSGETGSTAAGKPSYEIDVPNGGTTFIIGNVIMQPVGGNNPNIVAYGEEGVSGYATDLYVVNNTFINDESSRGYFVMVGGGVTTPAKLINNLFSGYGPMSTQASSIKTANYQALSVGFVNKAAYDLRPLANSLIVNAGVAPGNSTNGSSLNAAASYKHSASGINRTMLGTKNDIGAYEVQ